MSSVPLHVRLTTGVFSRFPRADKTFPAAAGCCPFLKYLAVSCCSVHFPGDLPCSCPHRKYKVPASPQASAPVCEILSHRHSHAGTPFRRYAPDPAESPLKSAKNALPSRCHSAPGAPNPLQSHSRRLLFYNCQAADAAIAPPCPVQPEMRCRASVHPQFRLLAAVRRAMQRCLSRPLRSALRRSPSPDTAPVSRTASPPARYTPAKAPARLPGA